MVTTTIAPGTMQPALIPVTLSNGEMKTNEICNSSGSRRAGDNRRNNKPIMEKRRRARINNCLNELKTLILDALKKDPARHSKLEKADILEMTVKYLQNIQRQHPISPTDSTVMNKFSAGFRDCATEVGRFPGLDPIVKKKLLQHLANCLNQTSKPQEGPKVQVHILPNSPQRNTELEVPQNGIIFSNGSGVQLVPTRLANGDIALVLPTTNQNVQVLPSPVPLLVPIVSERSQCNLSADSSYSPIASPEPMISMFCSTQERPLSLVIRKRDRSEESSDERPWRP